jgi:hypothetical protein
MWIKPLTPPMYGDDLGIVDTDMVKKPQNQPAGSVYSFWLGSPIIYNGSVFLEKPIAWGKVT